MHESQHPDPIFAATIALYIEKRQGPEELDFIINYDIKCRMCVDTEAPTGTSALPAPS